MLVVHVVRLDRRLRSAPHRFGEREVRVLDEQRDVADAVAMSTDVLGRRMMRSERRRDDEADLPLREDVRRRGAVARLQSAVRDLREAERFAVEVGGLLGVA